MSINILIVDDKEANLISLSGILEELGSEVNTILAKSGEEALRIAYEGDIRLIFLDIQMPVMDGFEVAQFLKSSKKTRDIPIIFLTAFFKSDEFMQKGFDIGALDYMTKPIDENQLLNRVRLYIKLFENQDKLKELNRDLEEKIKVEVEKNQKQQAIMELQNRQAQMGEMLSLILHQWKQPLNLISLLNDDILDAFENQILNEEYLRENTKKINQQIEYMCETAQSFKNFFKPEEEVKEFYLMDNLKDILFLVEKYYKKENISINIGGDENLKVLGCSNEFKQVILNIFANSKDAFKEKKINSPLIKVNLFKEDKNAIITISDNAGGIKDEIISKIFDPYVSSKKAKGGTGIGLYMSKTIIEKMNGEIFAQNRDDGAFFKIILPFI